MVTARIEGLDQLLIWSSQSLRDAIRFPFDRRPTHPRSTQPAASERGTVNPDRPGNDNASLPRNATTPRRLDGPIPRNPPDSCAASQIGGCNGAPGSNSISANHFTGRSSVIGGKKVGVYVIATSASLTEQQLFSLCSVCVRFTLSCPATLFPWALANTPSCLELATRRGRSENFGK